MHEDDNDSTIVFVTSAIIFYDKIVFTFGEDK